MSLSNLRTNFFFGAETWEHFARITFDVFFSLYKLVSRRVLTGIGIK